MPASSSAVVGVICGGPSAEAEVSRSSGREVAEALRATFRRVEVLELNDALPRRLLDNPPDVVFPVLHGPPGEDGTLQGFLDILGLPYVGSGVLASACAMDKVVAKRLFTDAGVTVAPDVVVASSDGIEEALAGVLDTFGPSVVVKPSGQGSAVGVTLCSQAEEVRGALQEALRYDDRVLVEQRVIGREITAAILERPDPQALPIVEVRTPEGTWYDFEHRYTQGLSQHVIPAPLPDDQHEQTCASAIAAHRALGCRDLSRVDFVVPPDGRPVVLEVNTMPGMTPTSLYPDAARAAGIEFPELVAHLAVRALERS